MTTVKSLDDLKKLREQALEKRKVKAAEGNSSGYRCHGNLWYCCRRTGNYESRA